MIHDILIYFSIKLMKNFKSDKNSFLMLIPIYYVYVVSIMKLTIPPEPKILKKQIIEQKKEIGLKIDTLTIWFGNRLPSYLWKNGGWSKPLKAEGYNWQSFLKILSLHKKEMIKWSKDTLSWRDFLLNIQETLKDPIFKKILVI
jgi:hypothetical protein